MKIIRCFIVFLSCTALAESFIKLLQIRERFRSKPQKKITTKTQIDASHKKPIPYVPPNILKKLRDVKSTNDFRNAFGLTIEKLPDHGLSGDEIEITSDPIGTAPVEDIQEGFDCIPRKKLVEVPMDNNAIHWPPCVYVKRCGGCCFNTRLMECQSSQVVNKSMTIYKIPYSTGQPIAEQIQIAEHASCQCQCRVKPTDCLPEQTFSAENCQCECRDAPKTCPPVKQWSQNTCRCECSLQQQCPNKFVWNSDTCSCECKRKKCRKFYELNKTTCRCNFAGFG